MTFARSIRLLALLSFSLLLSCSKKPASNERLHAVASIFPIYDMARTVAGEDADVDLLLQPGQNEHHFDPSPKEIARAAKSKVFVMVGLGLDPWMEKLAKDAAPEAKLLQVGNRVPTRPMPKDHVGEDEVAAHLKDAGKEDDDDAHGPMDPHVWLDPQRARLIVKAITEEFAKADVAHAANYRARGSKLEQEIDAVDAEAETRLKALSNKGFVTFHGSFGYFAERYGLTILAVIEPFPGSQPSGAYLQKVLSVIREKKVPALYSEPQLDSRPAKILADDAHIPLGTLDPVGGSAETDSYAKLIRFNVSALEKAQK